MKCSKNANKTKPKQCFQSLTIKNKNNDFDFLLQSIERQKYGTAINKENYHANDGRFSMKVRPFREDNSYMTCSVTNPLRQIKQLKEKGMNVNGENYESMIQKMKKYLSITEPMLEKGIVEEKYRKHGLFIAYEIVSMIRMVEQNCFSQKPKEQSVFSSLNNTSKIQIKPASTNLNVTNIFSSSFNQGQQSVQFIRKIQNLQEEKLYLENIISHHERANIKMFIKLNEGQSQEIEQYKKLLASLFEKYKQLQKLVKRESDKSRQLQKRLQQSKLVNVCGKKCQNNQSYLTSQIKSLQEIIYEQNESLSLALDELQKLKKRLEMYQALSFHEQSKKYSYQTKSTSFPLNDLSKSICSDAFPSMNAESHRNFSNISVISQNQVKNDESLYKMLMLQATAIDQLIRHKK